MDKLPRFSRAKPGPMERIWDASLVQLVHTMLDEARARKDRQIELMLVRPTDPQTVRDIVAVIPKHTVEIGKRLVDAGDGNKKQINTAVIRW